MGGWEKFPKKNKNTLGGGLGENKIPKKKKNWERGWEKIIYCKGRKFLPLTPDGKWLRTVVKYNKGVT